MRVSGFEERVQEAILNTRTVSAKASRKEITYWITQSLLDYFKDFSIYSWKNMKLLRSWRKKI